eukprot:m.631110 g.631110  ORF g.631110 m.631110 type:complete len:328 (+) comp22571_c1_seq5:3-986(+)
MHTHTYTPTQRANNVYELGSAMNACTFPSFVHTRITCVCSALKDGFGFITCAQREARLFFHASELLHEHPQGGIFPSPHSKRDTWPPKVCVGAEVAFAVTQPQHPKRENTDTSGSSRSPRGRGDRCEAVQVSLLPKGSVQFETLSTARFQGIVVQAANLKHSPGRRHTPGSSSYGFHRDTRADDASSLGLIEYTLPDTTDTCTVAYHASDCIDIRNPLQTADVVSFFLLTQRRTCTHAAVQLELVAREQPPDATRTPDVVPEVDAKRQVGYISALKGDFGFLESSTLEGETFFHFKQWRDKEAQQTAAIGDLVSYGLSNRGKKVEFC